MIFQYSKFKRKIFNCFKDQNLVVWNFKMWKIQNTIKWGLCFTIFEHFTISHIFFRFFGEIKVSASQNLNFGNSKFTIKWGLFFMIFPAQYDYTHFFPFCGKIKESQSQNLNSAIFLLTLKWTTGINLKGIKRKISINP